ncbi:MAG: type II secretion system protein J [Deltaproteobacteria bacterium]
MNRRSLTLIELLISCVLVVLVTLSAYTAFSTGRSGYSSIQLRAEQAQQVRVFLERTARDLHNSVVFSPKSAGFSGQPDRLSFFTVRDVYEKGEIGRRFSRVSFRYADGCLLIRYCDGRTAFASGEEGYDVLAEGVEECRFSYAAIDERNKRLLWKESWEDTVLPAAIRVQVAFKGADEGYAREIYLPR